MEESRNGRVHLKLFDSEAIEIFIRFIETQEFLCHEVRPISEIVKLYVSVNVLFLEV